MERFEIENNIPYSCLKATGIQLGFATIFLITFEIIYTLSVNWGNWDKIIFVLAALFPTAAIAAIMVSCPFLIFNVALSHAVKERLLKLKKVDAALGVSYLVVLFALMFVVVLAFSGMDHFWGAHGQILTLSSVLGSILGIKVFNQELLKSKLSQEDVNFIKERIQNRSFITK